MLNYNKKIGKSGFSLAEMLIVLTIMMIMMLVLPPLIKKEFVRKTLRIEHGRVDCYYNTDGNLVYYNSVE
ncbi:prepilin-type N-terminal cleavage/methylation domain-containing protein, partial [bacterium]|nr:prepilin-type N-terminal cleavage/methylation domain-containing protein [bacterium]